MLAELQLSALQQAATGKARMTNDQFAQAIVSVINNAGIGRNDTVMSGYTIVSLKRQTRLFGDVLTASII